MAQADDTSSTIDWIPLWESYQTAVSCFLTDVLADMRLREWLGSGQLPWRAESFEGPNADDIARLHREDSESDIEHILPSAAYYNGDPQFWRANPTVWWDKNAAREFSRFGARAMGIKVSRTHLDELLLQAGWPRKREAPEQTTPAEREKMDPYAWMAWALKEYPKQRNERTTIAHIRRLHGLAREADNLTEVWEFGTFRVRYYEAVKVATADRRAAQKARKFPRTV